MSELIFFSLNAVIGAKILKIVFCRVLSKKRFGKSTILVLFLRQVEHFLGTKKLKRPEPKKPPIHVTFLYRHLGPVPQKKWKTYIPVSS
jgi:hypothetical protein